MIKLDAATKKEFPAAFTDRYFLPNPFYRVLIMDVGFYINRFSSLSFRAIRVQDQLFDLRCSINKLSCRRNIDRSKVLKLFPNKLQINLQVSFY